ncbi:hypothetical protein, partial [uncultured Nostoc sp.]|uniref:hypothetical protein n=1 Tax=uncultured Nostoc sp. TaxID=340711 RepID=UPI0035CB7F9D
LFPPQYIRGGLGWGKTDAKTSVNQLFQTCVYTVAPQAGRLAQGSFGGVGFWVLCLIARTSYHVKLSQTE